MGIGDYRIEPETPEPFWYQCCDYVSSLDCDELTSLWLSYVEKGWIKAEYNLVKDRYELPADFSEVEEACINALFEEGEITW